MYVIYFYVRSLTMKCNAARAQMVVQLNPTRDILLIILLNYKCVSRILFKVRYIAIIIIYYPHHFIFIIVFLGRPYS
jgi:hypothetical protein